MQQTSLVLHAGKQWQLAKKKFNFCIAATPARDVRRQQLYHSLRAEAEYGLGELPASQADTELAHALDPVKAVSPLCPACIVITARFISGIHANTELS